MGSKMEEELARSQEGEGRAEVELRSSESRFCQVCQASFLNYWEHIGQKTHVRKMRQSSANLHMEELCSQFHPRSPAPLPAPPAARSTKKRRRNQEGGFP